MNGRSERKRVLIDAFRDPRTLLDRYIVSLALGRPRATRHALRRPPSPAPRRRRP